MAAAKYRHLIIIEQVTEAADGRGELTATWSTWPGAASGVWAEIKPFVPGRANADFLAHGKTVAIDTRISIAYIPGVTGKMRVNHSGRIYTIDQVINAEERNKELNLMCVEHS